MRSQARGGATQSRRPSDAVTAAMIGLSQSNATSVRRSSICTSRACARRLPFQVVPAQNALSPAPVTIATWSG